MKKIVLKKGKEIAISRRHPWVFSGALRPLDSDIQSGDKVWIVDFQDQVIASGHYHASSIAVRILSFESEEIDQDFYNKKILQALEKRKILQLPNSQTNAFRLIAGEGDGLSGLIIDFYNGHCVMQCHTEGMYQDVEMISKALQTAFGESLKTIYLKDIHIKNKGYEGRFLLGDDVKTIIEENGNQFEINWVEGQKTGFFLDQRENRNLVSKYIKGKNVLNAYCYTGGFSVYALKAEAKSVKSVDISSSAIELTNKNVELNGSYQNHVGIVQDVIQHLKEIDQDFHDLIILDPPAFAKSRKKSNNAIQAYKRINALAMQKIKRGGMLFTFSCSQVINRNTFEHTVRSAAIEIGRDIQIVHVLSQGPDHLIDIYHPEGHYLKGLALIIH